MSRFFTRQELADAYRLPKHVLEPFLGEFAPVEKEKHGEIG